MNVYDRLTARVVIGPNTAVCVAVITQPLIVAHLQVDTQWICLHYGACTSVMRRTRRLLQLGTNAVNISI